MCEGMFVVSWDEHIRESRVADRSGQETILAFQWHNEGHFLHAISRGQTPD